MKPLPTQLSGARFLASRRAALLADSPRVGKTGAAIMGADYIFARRVLTITTASGRAVWRRAVPSWSIFPHKVQIVKTHVLPATTWAIVGWAQLTDPTVRAALLAVKWDLIIPDEDHYAKDFSAKRTQALYGALDEDNDAVLHTRNALYTKAGAVWRLTGTPLPNSPFDAFPALRALTPERLKADPARGWLDVTAQSAFKKRYCKIRPMKIGRGGYKRWIDVIVSGQNEDELAARMEGLYLKRTQKDVGIREPVHEILPLIVDERLRRQVDALPNSDLEAILNAAENDDTRTLDMMLGPIRRLTGEAKAHAVVEAVGEEFNCGLDKIVLMRWHKDVGRILREGLSKYGVVSVEGATSARDRALAEERFRDDPKVRVFDGQIQAAGEAIDLSAAAVLWFVETSIIPKDMKQASLRITNHAQTRNCFVKVCALEGSIDEALQTILLRKWASIREVMK